MRRGRGLRPEVLQMIRSFPKDAHPMELLQSVISYLSGYVTHKIRHSPTCNCQRTLHQVSQVATVVAAWQRFQEGKDPVPPRDDLSHGANFLYMLKGTDPEPDSDSGRRNANTDRHDNDPRCGGDPTTRRGNLPVSVSDTWG